MSEEKVVKVGSNSYVVEQLRDFDLDNIFDCGQCFRWTREEDGSYTGIAFGKVVNMKVCENQNGKSLVVENSNKQDYDEIWSKYMDMERDYGKIKRNLGQHDEVMIRAIDAGPGIRILRQELWETMVSFIISQNNNIPRIKGCIEKLCTLKGEYVGNYKGKDFYAIPSPNVLAQLKVRDLEECRLGYRAPYLIETAGQVVDAGGIEKVQETLLSLNSCHEVLDALMKFQGIGPKVANCIALFGLGRLDAFPIDVWVRRVMSRLYGIDEKDVKTMAEYAEKNFGNVGGIAQQYLFYYIRGLE